MKAIQDEIARGNDCKTPIMDLESASSLIETAAPSVVEMQALRENLQRDDDEGDFSVQYGTYDPQAVAIELARPIQIELQPLPRHW